MMERIRAFAPRKGGFGRNVLVLATGTTLAQAIPVAMAPVLTRLYGPEDFGVLAVFIAVTMVMGSIATARYELAIMLADDEEDATDLVYLCLGIAATISLLLLIAVLLGRSQFEAILGNDEVGGWLFLAPPTVFLAGVLSALTYFHTRHKNFSVVAKATVSKSIATVGVQVAAGLAGAGHGGLVVGQAASGVASNGRLIRPAIRLSSGKRPDLGRMRVLAKRFKRFPIYSMPAILANNLATQATNVLVSAFYSLTTLGYYSIVQRIVGMPSALIGQAVGQVYFQAATEEKKLTGRATHSFRSTSVRLAIVGLPIFVALFLISPVAFEVAFGDQWRIAGEYARILTPMFFVKFVVVGISTTGSVFEKQAFALVWQVVLLLICIVTVVACHLSGASVKTFFLAFTVANVLHYIVLWLALERISRGS